ncbi:SDR family NAD(P)-dependent oxidoreductase, partial [uncultured Nevskia sp.]|uniref:SDR family NAD(P)-dependent oxidoreductase n=1 Tax=uncultured Nevskia sp. TaxID=228950 RepID=UPI0025EC9FDD
MNQKQDIAIVVGATGAMGQVIARRLAARGLKVIAVARSADSVAALASGQPNIVACVADIAS